MISKIRVIEFAYKKYIAKIVFKKNCYRMIEICQINVILAFLTFAWINIYGNILFSKKKNMERYICV